MTYTCAHAHARATQTHTESHANASPSLCLPDPHPFPLLLQTKAWKAGHKGECVAAARADTRTAAKPTADHMRVLETLEQLADAADWRGVAAQEQAAKAVAAAVRTSMPGIASFVYNTLGREYDSLRDFSKAIEYHTPHLAIAKEVGDRAEEGMAYGNLGNAYRSQGDFSKAIEYHTQCMAIAKEVGDRAGEGRTYGNLGNSYESQGDFSKAI